MTSVVNRGRALGGCSPPKSDARVGPVVVAQWLGEANSGSAREREDDAMGATDDLPDPLAVWSLINNHVVSRCIHVIADLGVADALGDEPVSADELAARTGMSADALARML